MREQLLALTAEDSAEVDALLAPELDDVEVCWSAWWVSLELDTRVRCIFMET